MFTKQPWDPAQARLLYLEWLGLILCCVDSNTRLLSAITLSPSAASHCSPLGGEMVMRAGVIIVSACKSVVRGNRWNTLAAWNPSWFNLNNPLVFVTEWKHNYYFSWSQFRAEIMTGSVQQQLYRALLQCFCLTVCLYSVLLVHCYR